MMYRNRACGFTLIELIMVLVVLGALSIFVLPRLNSSDFDSLSFEQELKTAIRYAHKLSVASECEVQVALTASSYALYYPDSTCNPPTGFGAVPVNHLLQSGAYAGNAPSGVTMSGLGSFFFRANGSPSGSGTITINPGARQIVVNSQTGFVQ